MIITCDCGISNLPEIKAAKDAGMQVIITDHHSIPAELPPADAIIHPKVPGEPYPDKGLAGGAVAFKLAAGLLKKHHEKTELLPDGQTHEAFEKWLLDLVAIATIGDMVPLVGESRTLARYGLTVLNKTRNLGLQKLCFIAGIGDEQGRPKRGSYDATSVGFQIVPRLNAAGRMDHANTACALLLAASEEEALKLAEQLNQNNLDRQKLTENCVLEARAQIKSTNQTENPIIFAFNKNWTTGILGLVSGKLKDEYGKPAIVLGINDGEVVGSGRSISEFSLISALQSMPEFFDKFGGHPQACGLTLKSLDIMEEFQTALIAKAKIELAGKDLTPNINIDAEVDLDEVNWKLFDLLQKFEPFGQNNERPKYSATNLTVVDISPIGQDGKHLRLMVKHNSHLVRKTIAFGFGDPNRHPMNWKEV
ncbi:MAG: Single-stranded-DNA-specific exonuclease RecJ [Candidatus Magasanikbacteria bacterium GW2011_GWA2_37_8]|uniref:Single-stranded-DNA-specific exonuclease RecJ n=1 Tax=Candidatus Magasanikbacteria bacterium GW2011_GWA2_37_8 TaxID=1619036 RepID=A0A0G0KI77_9BACT|nr:MAG: Single-stranded-DNA-specific exonuclease RecJ [Candidatus Magasanikbacteria bacterium GW2011_GWA2_37_8]